jgi:hypothetical protein
LLLLLLLLPHCCHCSDLELAYQLQQQAAADAGADAEGSEGSAAGDAEAAADWSALLPGATVAGELQEQRVRGHIIL